MTTKDRLKEFLSFKKMGRNKFEEKVGISTGYMSSKSTSITSEVIEKAKNEFPDLNLDWLLTGKGEKTLSYNNSNSGQNFGSIGGDNKSSYMNVGNTINVSLPESGTQKIIKPDGSVEIQSLSSSASSGLNDADRLNQRIQDLERIILEKDATIKSKEETIWALKTMLDRQ